MLSLANSLDHLRKFLRDPDGGVWTDSMLFSYWKRALIEVAQKTGAVVVAEVRKYPQEYTYATTFGWERQFAEGDVWTPFTFWEAGEMACTYEWEAVYGGDSDVTVAGSTLTQPFESAYAEPSQLMPILVGGKHLKTVYAAFDKDAIDMTTMQALGRLDGFYRDRTGTPTHWYWWDNTDMAIVLYPRPSPVLDDLDIDEVFDDDGGIVLFEDGRSETADEGIVIESLDLDDNLFFVYQLYATPGDLFEDVDYPKWLRHFVEACVLEYAYSADTDGFIPSLRDYWTQRKKVAFQMTARLKTMGMRDRMITRGGSVRRGARVEPTLPSEYPDPIGWR